MSMKRLYLLCPAFLAIITAALVASPGCGSDTCQGARAKICEKACACSSKCTVSGIDFDSKVGCSSALGVQCDPTKHNIDWAACSKALDTAMCSGGPIPDGGPMDEDGGIASVLIVPDECNDTSGLGGGSPTGSGGGSASSATSSGSM